MEFNYTILVVNNVYLNLCNGYVGDFVVECSKGVYQTSIRFTDMRVNMSQKFVNGKCLGSDIFCRK